MKIIGWKISIYTNEYPVLGWIVDYNMEFGASPVRDKKARYDFIKDLITENRTFSVEPISSDGP
jgi:hypothetical protein